MPDYIGPPYSHESAASGTSTPLRIAPGWHPQLTLGALELQNKTTGKSLSLSPFAFMNPLRQRGVRQSLPRHSASRRISTPQLTLGALELQNSNTAR